MKPGDAAGSPNLLRGMAFTIRNVMSVVGGATVPSTDVRTTIILLEWGCLPGRVWAAQGLCTGSKALLKVCLCVVTCVSVLGCDRGHTRPGSMPGYTCIDVPLCLHDRAEGSVHTRVVLVGSVVRAWAPRSVSMCLDVHTCV